MAIIDLSSTSLRNHCDRPCSPLGTAKHRGIQCNRSLRQSLRAYLCQFVRFAHLAVLISLVFSIGAALAQKNDEWLVLARSGAQKLAISLIDQEQLGLLIGTEEWQRLEKARLTILEDSQHWKEALDRISNYPDEINQELMPVALTLKARALLNLNKPISARRVLRGLIWGNSSAPYEIHTWYPRWRQLIIQSYLLQGQLSDAATALLLYQQDYGSRNSELLLLQARTMIAAGEPEAVESILKQQTSPEAEALKLLSSLNTKSQAVADILVQAEELAEQEEFGPTARRRFCLIASKAAATAGKMIKQIAFLEHAIALSDARDAHDSLFSINADRLWTAYLDAGLTLGTNMQLTGGNDASWLEAALTFDEKEPIKARAIYAVLVLQGQQPRYRNVAHQRLADSLISQSFGDAVVNALYTQSNRFDDFRYIPASVRARLSDYNLAKEEVGLAIKLLQGIDQPPVGYDTFNWQLLLSRVAILSGREEIAIKLLEELLGKLESPMDRSQAERIIRILLDMQRVGRHEASIALFDLLLPWLSDPQQSRQLRYWQAEAYRMLNQPKLAAHLYMHSAGFSDELLTDPWGQFARFNAAEALAEAALIEDSRRIYKQVLQETEATGHRAVILHKLQLLPAKNALLNGAKN